MMYSVIAFLMTAIEMGLVIAGFAWQIAPLFYDMLVYGSPLFLVQHAVGSESLLHEKNPLYLAFGAFHLIKYFVFFQGQRLEDPNIFRKFAMLFEAIYIALSAYYQF